MCEYEDTKDNGTKPKEENTMEANKIKGEAKAIKLANGAELTYCERGESNEEIVIMPGFFFYTFMARGIRKVEEGLAKKMEEAAAIGMNKNDPATAAKTQAIIQTYASAPEMIWGSKEACAEGLKNMNIPVGFLFGTEDEFFDDHFDSNMWAIRNTRGSRTIFLQGEHHLMELDCPQRVVEAAFDFFDDCEKGYYKELMG